MVLRMLKPALNVLDTRSAMPAKKVVDRFYLSAEWRALMKQLIEERGRACEDPRHDPGKSRRAGPIYGDHIVERQDGGAELDPNNVMLRCASCHGRKTSEERARRMAERPGGGR